MSYVLQMLTAAEQADYLRKNPSVRTYTNFFNIFPV